MKPQKAEASNLKKLLKNGAGLIREIDKEN